MTQRNNIVQRITRIGLLVITLLFMGCNNEPWLNNREQNEVNFSSQAGGAIDSTQFFVTAVLLNVHATIPFSGELYAAVHLNNTPYICYHAHVTSDTTFQLTVPQGYDPYVTFMIDDGYEICYSTVGLNGALNQDADVQLIPENKPLAPTRAPEVQVPYRLAEDTSDKNDRYNPSSMAAKNIGYFYFPGNLWRRLDDILPDRQDPELWDHVVNFEYRTSQTVELSMLMGNNGGTTKRILGYYYHSPGTYEDFTMKDIAEVNYHNYIDSVPKAQLRHKGSSGWELIDFSTTFRQEKVTNFTQIDSLRGLTFQLAEMPVGKLGGFYLKWDTPNAEQYRKLLELGIPANRLPAYMTEINFTNKQLNVDGRHRCVITQIDDYLVLGMEDLGITGDYDCNDMIFSITPNTLLDDVVDLENHVDSFIGAKPLSWTIAYEDVYRDNDFDYNDAVIRIKPDYDKQTADIYAAAAGTDQDIILYYDSEDGIQELGNIRRLLGGGTFINTLKGQSYVSPVKIATIAWPRYFTMTKDSPRLIASIRRGDCSQDCSDELAVNITGGQIPSAICVAGEWQWPVEGASIFNTYPYFGEWTRRQQNMQYWSWYQK